MDTPSSAPGVGIKPLLSLQRHYRLSIGLFLLMMTLGLPIVWTMGQSKYFAEATFQVAPRYMKNLESDDEVQLQSNSQYREFVNQLQNTVTRYDVIARALQLLEKQGINTRPPGLSQRQYIESLQRLVITRAIPDTYMVRIRLEGGNGEKPHLDKVVNAIMAAFLETSKAEQIYGSDERLNVLKDNERKLRAEIDALDDQRAKLGGLLGLTTFNDGVQNPYDIQLTRLREDLAKAEVERKRSDAIYTAFREKGEVPNDIGRSLLEMRQTDLNLVALRAETAKRVAALQQQMAGLTAKHPARAPAEEEIQQLKNALERAENHFIQANKSSMDTSLQASVQQKRKLEDGIRQSVNNLENQASQFAQLFHRAMQLTRDINDRYERLQRIQKRLNYLETESNALGFVRLVTAALPAEVPQGPGKTRLLLVLILLSTGAAIALPSIIDLFYDGIRSVNEAEKLLGIPAAGWQIRREDLPTRIFSEEQSRRFAATLMRIKARENRPVFTFSAVKSQGGTTLTVLDTASTLQSLGARVLIIEANAFTPFAGFDALQPGLKQLLQHDLAAEQVIHHYQHAGTTLDVIPVGSQDGQGLQRLDRLGKALSQWQDGYEYILFDLPPILLSADAEMLIEQLKQVFLLVSAESVSKGEISRAKRLLQKIDPQAVGLFVNSIPLFRGSGYMEENVIEAVTHGRADHFMTEPSWLLKWEILLTSLATYRRRLLTALRVRTAAQRKKARHPHRG